MSIYKIFNQKIINSLTTGMERMHQAKNVFSHSYAKYLALSNTLKSLWNGRKRLLLTNLVQYTQKTKLHDKSQKSLLKT